MDFKQFAKEHAIGLAVALIAGKSNFVSCSLYIAG